MALVSFGTYEAVRSLLLQLEHVQQQRQEEEAAGRQRALLEQQLQEQQEEEQWCVLRSLEASATPLQGG